MSNEKVTSLWEDYENGLAYQGSIGITEDIPKYVRFFEGDQWAKPTKKTINLPRPVVNIIRMICRNKKAMILSTPVKIIYRAEDDKADVDKFNRFAEFIQKEMGQDALDKQAIEDAVKKGSYFYHYYWDTEAKGKDGIKEGGLRCELIDPLNIFFSNPCELDEQKQEWILIASRENIKSVKAKADKDVDIELIREDEKEDKYGTIEQEGTKLCTVLTRYFRKNGMVYCEKATKNVVVNKPFSITPNVNALGTNTEEDAPNNSLPDSNEENLYDGYSANLYPIVAGYYEKREKCIYGLSETKGLIPNQKAINFNLAMMLLNNQEMAWGKYIVTPNALRGQSITNEPAQVLVDYSGTGNGIRKLTEQALQSQPLQLIDTLTQLTRVVSGSSEVMTGETIGANMSGSAIAQLQAQAQTPIKDLKENFWNTKEKQGKILVQFFKLFYAYKEFTYKLEDNDKQLQKDVFNSQEYTNIDFAVVVECSVGTNSSSAGDINILEGLLKQGMIDIETFIKCYPKDALANRSELLKAVEERKTSQVNVLSEQLKQAQEHNLQLTQLLEKQKQTVNNAISCIQENERLKQMIVNLRAEAVTKINQANQVIMQANQGYQQATQDASTLANHIIQNEVNQ